MLAPCIVREARILRGAQHAQRGVNGGTITHCHTYASKPGERHERVAAWTQRRRDQQQAAAAAAPEALAAASGDEDERRDDDGDGTRSSGDELADDTGRIAAGNNVAQDCQTERIPSRTRRTDYVLGLATPAISSLRQQLGGGDTRLVHARRKHGDG